VPVDPSAFDPRAAEHQAHVADNAGNLARRGAAKHPSVSHTPPVHGGMFHVKDGTLNAGVTATQVGHAPDGSSPLFNDPSVQGKSFAAVKPAVGMRSRCVDGESLATKADHGARMLAGATRTR
jgi:hypothetical protein